MGGVLNETGHALLLKGLCDILIAVKVDKERIKKYAFEKAVDYSSIYSSISDCLKDYHEYCNYILIFLEQYRNR